VEVCCVSTIAVCTSRGLIAGFGTFAGAVRACTFDATRRGAAVFRPVAEFLAGVASRRAGFLI